MFREKKHLFADTKDLFQKKQIATQYSIGGKDCECFGLFWNSDYLHTKATGSYTKETYSLTKETYAHTKETYSHTKETYQHTKSTFRRRHYIVGGKNKRHIPKKKL